ncbi:MAG: response regulator [Magnetococcus sp. YQC-5]
MADEIRQALDQDDLSTARDLVHTMKGMAGNLAATDLFHAAHAMEESIESGKIQEEPSLLITFETELKRVLATVQTLSTVQTSPTPPTEATEPGEALSGEISLEARLQELSHRLQTQDTDAELSLAALKQTLTQNNCQETLQRMEAQVYRLDYRSALTTLEHLEQHIGMSRTGRCTMSTTKQKILIVDDQPENIHILRDLLRSDYNIYFAMNGHDALDIVTAIHPDLILLDVVMPKLDGFAVCARIKSREETQNIPIIFITAKNSEEDETRALALGAVDFISKPFNPPVVKARVQTHLNLVNTFAQLRDRESLLRSILDNAMDAIITTDSTGTVLDFNPAAEQLFGYQKADITGQEISTLIVPPESREQHLTKMRQFVAHADPAVAFRRRFEVTGMKSDASKVDIEVSLATSRRGKALYFTAFAHDISERRLLLNSLNQTLKSAELANRAKSEFLANMSHEIRTPMNAIIGLTQLAMKSGLTPKQQDYLIKIDKSSHSMLSVINDILDFSRIEAGKMRLTPIAFNLQDVFDHLNDMFAHQVAEKGIALHWFIAQDIPILWGDAMRLEQVLTNLIGNAIKFTERGDVMVQTTLREQYARRVVLEFLVRDSGIGIAPDRLLELFEPFVQADGSITRKYGGTGLGLVICKRIVNMMGGQIWVESHEGSGSTFHFTAAFEPRSSDEEQRSKSSSNLHQLNVLLVGEQDHSTEIIEEIFHSLTFLTTLVHDPTATVTALQKAHEANKPYALLVLNQHHLAQDMVHFFIEVTRQLGDRAPSVELPKSILLTNGERISVTEKATAAGISACFDQPVKRSLFFNTLLEMFNTTAVYTPPTEQLGTTDAHFEAVLGGTHVLVVEDNPINRQVIRELLERVGVTVEEADHGGIALRMLQTARYDVVLMDLQMPEMDGLTATRVIRSNARFKDLPIIAMTAHAMEEDRQKCLSVGMNDHVGKPINLHDFYKTLAKWVTVELASAPAAPIHAVENNTIPLPDLPGVDTADGLERLAGNRSLYEKLLRQMVEDHSQDAERIAHALANSDYLLAERLTHTLKSIAGQLGAHALHKAARNLEESIAQQNDQIDRFKKIFDVSLSEVIDSLFAFSSQPSVVAVPNTVAALDVGLLGPLLQQLAVLLREQDSKADTLLDPLSTQLRGHSLEAVSHTLTQHIKHYDYESALSVLGEIAHLAGISLK